MSPISKENRALYPADWKKISQRIRFERANGRCECTGECGHEHPVIVGDTPVGRCAKEHGHHYMTANRKGRRFVKCVLTVAHLDSKLVDHSDKNLKGMCQWCHLRLDAKQHARNASDTRDRKRGQGRLFA